MKKNLLLTFALLILSMLSFAQSIKYDPGDANKIYIDTIGRDFLVGKKEPFVSGASAIQNTSKRTIFWLEPGDGFFTKDPIEPPHSIIRKQSHNPLMLTTNLYDTTRYPPPTSLIHHNTKSPISTITPVSHTQYFSSQGVKITPSVYDIVPGDTMVFALTYKTFKNDTAIFNPASRPQRKIIPDSTFKLYFFYNNNSIFEPITAIQTLGSIPIDNIRFHYNETPSFNQNIPINKLGCSNWVCYNIPNNLDIEKTVFVSLVPTDTVQTGKSGSVYAVLTDGNNNEIARDSIGNMLVAPAHDPNYLVQRPVCLLYGKNKAKKEYPFEYKVHFQNTGLGDAIEAKVIIHLPKGMNWSTFKITQASFANADYTNVFKERVNMFINKIDNTVTVQFKENALIGSIHKLRGTSSCNNPYTNPLTMGEIAFTIKSTPNTDDSLFAYADILFMSENKSNYALTIGGGYEDTVRTNIAVTRYKECCTCPPPKPTCCYIILGLCWWWWIIILLAIIIIWWLLLKRKKNRNQTKYQTTDNQC